eukprot:Gb_02145 [translate_table: standard]
MPLCKKHYSAVFAGNGRTTTSLHSIPFNSELTDSSFIQLRLRSSLKALKPSWLQHRLSDCVMACIRIDFLRFVCVVNSVAFAKVVAFVRPCAGSVNEPFLLSTLFVGQKVQQQQYFLLLSSSLRTRPLFFNQFLQRHYPNYIFPKTRC